MRRQMVAVAVVLLASVSNAWADNITYNIVNYPANQADQVHSGTDTLLGTIITNGALGILTSDDIVGGSLTFLSPVSSDTGILDRPSSGVSGLLATPSQLLMPQGAVVGLIFTNPSKYLYLDYGSPGFYSAKVTNLSAQTLALFGEWDPPPPVSGSIAASDPWVIATVAPEPGTLTLLVSALLGLAGAGCLGRRKAKA